MLLREIWQNIENEKNKKKKCGFSFIFSKVIIKNKNTKPKI